MVQNLCSENVWLDKCKYDEAEREYYESKAKKEVQTPLAAEVGKAREWLTNIKKCIEEPMKQSYSADQTNTLATLEAQVASFSKEFSTFESKLNDLVDRVKNLESRVNVQSAGTVSNAKKSVSEEKKEEDDVDLFGSESEEDDDAVEIREKRLAAYAAKKSKKPVLIAKSNIILDVKPWDDETDMKQMETSVRAITTEGLLWGASKLVPLAYGIHKLQISCVVEDDIVSVDWLQEQIESVEDFVQSVDIAAFNKV